MDKLIEYLPWIGGAAALVMAFLVQMKVMAAPAGNERMAELAKAIQDGAKAFLVTEYKLLAIFVVVVAGGLFALGEDMGGGMPTMIAFLAGAFASALAGWIGMHTATRAAVRTTEAARTGLAPALKVAFGSGTVMGMTVVGLGVLGISIFVAINGTSETGLQHVLGFSFGASSIALFARVGGGIYTKAADVGADLVGKVEAGIPEDDPRNPATIADNVGDNVGDVAGMGADLFESYVGSIIAAMTLGAAALIGEGGGASGLITLPLALSACGIFASIIGTVFVKTNDESKIHSALFNGLIVASVILLGFAYFLTNHAGLEFGENFTGNGLFFAILAGLASGVIIGKITEYYTAFEHKPVQNIAEQSETGEATNIIAGLGVGMKSTMFPVIVLCITIGIAFNYGGIYGIALAAVGMLSTLGISLGVDAYGPVADNAGGMAEMAELPPEVRERTDALDAVGNTTAAVGKGFAIGSATLTALAFFSAYGATATKLYADKGLGDFNLAITEPNVVIGLLFGAMLPFMFAAMTMEAVGRAAFSMIEEVRRQFREIPGILEGTGKPDYAACVSISTKGSLKEMVLPGLLAIAAPILVGLFGGVVMLGGMLAGSLAAGVMMALFMANAGGAWDNAKKYIEKGHHGGKGSDPHKAAVVGDTVGDPFKDTSGPSLNILLKLMSVVSLLLLPFFIGS
ncbi:MAG: sodium-translocating pyrophosphatase [Planctomycetes bacterium]|nr:sodium-translocating pyrophosphatase [Planctomycetota bacterium]MCP4769972.1 sodium-translocating pyrophosphatase [Planctomycetota bacterium]MCP4859812.1 sodium-translocating pyrophosphatase [Planctomycetota bacterium]